MKECRQSGPWSASGARVLPGRLAGESSNHKKMLERPGWMLGDNIRSGVRGVVSSSQGNIRV